MKKIAAVAGASSTGYVLVSLSDSKVKLHYSESSFLKEKIKNCPSLFTDFYPTPWLFNGVLQAIYGGKIDKPLYPESENAPYEREFIKMPDNGILSIDWKFPENSNDSTKILLVAPGLTGCSASHYIRSAVSEGLAHGYKVGVIHGRGIGKTPLRVIFS